MIEAIYDTNAKEFIESWLSADMHDQYKAFETLVHPGARILDGGCGSGRDSLYFLQKGYVVDAFDPSDEMIKYASEFTGLKVNKMKWEDLDAKEAYDAIWASASLYHVARPDMAPTFKKIANALKSKGILFASFRDKENDFVDSEGRALTSFNKETLTSFLSTLGLFDIVALSERKDTRKNKQDEVWLFALLRKKI